MRDHASLDVGTGRFSYGDEGGARLEKGRERRVRGRPGALRYEERRRGDAPLAYDSGCGRRAARSARCRWACRRSGPRRARIFSVTTSTERSASATCSTMSAIDQPLSPGLKLNCASVSPCVAATNASRVRRRCSTITMPPLPGTADDAAPVRWAAPVPRRRRGGPLATTICRSTRRSKPCSPRNASPVRRLSTLCLPNAHAPICARRCRRCRASWRRSRA